MHGDSFTSALEEKSYKRNYNQKPPKTPLADGLMTDLV